MTYKRKSLYLSSLKLILFIKLLYQMTDISNKMTLKDYYHSLDENSPRANLKDKIISECGISPATFYNWVNGNTSDIPKTAKERISEIIGIQVDELFPVNS